jgi:hypothetical protein
MFAWPPSLVVENEQPTPAGKLNAPMIPSMQGSVFAPDLQLMTIAAYACFPQPLDPALKI